MTMRPARIILSSVLISTMIALIISYLPGHVLSFPANDEISVFQWKITRPIELTNENIVDFINDQTLHHQVRYVEWSNNRLSIDLTYSQLTSAEAYADFAYLVNSAFTQTDNVEYVLLRLFDESVASKPLSLSLLVSRQNVANALPKLNKLGSDELESFLLHSLGLKQTGHWLKSKTVE